MKQNETNERIKGYKIFDSDFTCRDMKYKVGETFKVNGEIVICKNGIHFCLSPFDCLDYYPFIDCNGNFNKFAQVEGYGKIDKNTTNNRTKVAVSNLDVIKELTLKDFINDGIEFIHKETKVAGSSGDYAKIGSSGNYAQIGSSGYSAKISSFGDDCVICCAGRNSIAKGKKGSWITLSEWEYSAKKRAYVPVCVKTKKIDGAEIKEDTFYRLKNGEFVEVKGE